MSDLLPEVDFPIVGAGPVGLFLANECARHGLHYRIVEARSTQSEHGGKPTKTVNKGFDQPYGVAISRSPKVIPAEYSEKGSY
jgi:2-polyprenyl-6-methoxyphenol hydroxylase-like FAD-dependent oxidoreductase